MRTSDLDPFESALLGELRGEVQRNAAAARSATQARPSTPARRRRPIALALAGAGALGVGAVAVPMLTTSAAFSVDERNGALTVQVERLEGAGALEEELLRHGVEAQVVYLEPGMGCQADRYDDVTPRGASLSVGAEDFIVTLPAGAVGPGEIFVLSAAIEEEVSSTRFRSVVDFGVASGEVAPCVPEPAEGYDELP